MPKNTERPSTNPDVFLSYRVVETGEGGDGSVFALREGLESVGYSVFVGEQDLKARAGLASSFHRPKAARDCIVQPSFVEKRAL